MRGKSLVVAAMAVALAGCGAQDVRAEGLESPAPPSLPTDLRTSAPPNGPTDQIKKTAFVVGTVTRDSSGPCYGLETDDGTQYALHSASGAELVKGRRMRIKTAPLLARIDCGPGTPREMVSSELLR